jgi:biopolymer transport protein TolR
MAFESDSRHDNTSISQINVTPLVDVMLVLLVIFMVTAPILQQGVNVNLPAAKTGALQGEEQQLVVSLTKEGAYYLNDHRVSLEDLQGKLRSIIRLRPDRQVYLRADQSLRYGQVMRAVAAIKEAGIQKIGMVTQPPS